MAIEFAEDDETMTLNNRIVQLRRLAMLAETLSVKLFEESVSIEAGVKELENRLTRHLDLVKGV